MGGYCNTPWVNCHGFHLHMSESLVGENQTPFEKIQTGSTYKGNYSVYDN